jgi:ribosomal protein L37E
MSYEPKAVLCETCGKLAFDRDTRRCANCWEIEGRLNLYMRSPKALERIRKYLPLLDDWVNGQPDAWTYEDVLRENNVTVEWCDTLVDGNGNKTPAGDMASWSMAWKHGCMDIGPTTETIARKAAALFVALWLRGVSASFADKLADGFICYLERQESVSLTFLAEIDSYPDARPYFRLSRENFLPIQHDAFTNVEWRIIESLDAQPDEEIIVTFTTRKK